ncbi:cation transporter [bacterium]|nr:cation transporter [bacterium]
MSHDHSHKKDNIQLAFFLNLSFALLEIGGGLWTNSMAILSDALHDFGDTFSLGLAWVLEKFSKKGRDSRYSYGYLRFSLLGAIVNIIVLLGGSLIILSRSIPRLIAPESTNAPGMLVFAITGMAVNGFAMLRLKNDQSMNARVVALHMLEDMLGWAAVFIVSIMLIFTDFFILDPLLSILITAVILFNVIRNLKKTASLFLQASPDQISLEKIESELRAIKNVESVHHMHAWSLDGEHHVLTTHIVVKNGTAQPEIQRIKNQVRALGKLYHFMHITIETEFTGEDCSMQP